MQSMPGPPGGSIERSQSSSGPGDRPGEKSLKATARPADALLAGRKGSSIKPPEVARRETGAVRRLLKRAGREEKILERSWI